MNEHNEIISNPGTQFALVLSQARGFHQSIPSNYREFLRYVEALPNKIRDTPHSFAWRGRNKSASFKCKMAFAVSDIDFTPFDPRLLDKSGSIIKTKISGAARRRTMIWNGRILAVSAQLIFSKSQRSNMPWSHYVKNSIVEIDKYDEVEKNLLPSAQLRLFSGIQDQALGGVVHAELGKILNLHKLFDGIAYKVPKSNKRVPRGSRVSERQILTACFLVGGKKTFRQYKHRGDEWSAWPVFLPPKPVIETSEQIMAKEDHARIRQARSFDVGIVVERKEYGLDEDAIARFTRALEHFSVHIAQLQSLRRLVNDWWEPMLNPPTWEKKKIAAGNFLRAWQQHALHVDPLWNLGANDPQADPTIVASLDRAIGLTNCWECENRRLGDLVRLSTQVLRDGDPSIHLNVIR